MYKIIGADQKEYGPITAEQIRQWISEGRLNAETRACLEGTQEWKPLRMFPEFSFVTSPLVGNLPAPETGPGSMQEILARDYTLDIMSCISRGWNTLMSNFGAVTVPFLLLALVSFGTGIAVQIILWTVGVNRMPFAERQYIITPVYLVANALVIYPVLGGFYGNCLSVVRGLGTDIGELFIGFKSSFADLFLAKLVTGIALSVCMIPYNIASAAKIGALMDSMQASHPTDPMAVFSQMFSALAGAFPIFLICLIPITYLSVNWVFTLPLIVDKQLGFWTAMMTSWRIVHKHWFPVFGLAVLIGIFNLLGALVCCVGLLVSFPLGVIALMFAYEDIFGRKTG
jgi:uncharacterized membrane protein